MALSGITFFEKVKKIVLGHLDITYAPVTNNITTIVLAPSDELLKQSDPKTVVLDYQKIIEALPDAKKDALRKAVREEVSDTGIPLLEDKSKDLVEDVAIIEKDRDIHTLLTFFKGKIPPEDYAALRAAIYIKHKFDARAPAHEIELLKSELRSKFGTRGLKISKLWSEGYFTKLIKPLYDELHSHDDFSEKAFLAMYNLIVEEEAFAIFVSSSMTIDQLRAIVQNKVTRNMRYGVYFLTIHGIGRECVDTIRGIIPDIESDYEVIHRDISEKNFIIRAKFWFKKET